MVLEISSSNTSGTIHYGRSFISLLQQELETYIKFDGLIESKIDGNRMRYHSSHKNKLTLKMNCLIVFRYQTQYSAMESTIAGLNEALNLLENAFKRNSD